MEQKQNHWNSIYSHKQPDAVSWTQQVPQTSIDFIRSFNTSKASKIIDIGPGEM